MFCYHDSFRKELATSLSLGVKTAFGLDFSWEKVYSLLGATPSKEAGDMAFPLFLVAKEVKTNPAMAAKALEAALGELPSFVVKKVAMGALMMRATGVWAWVWEWMRVRAVEILAPQSGFFF